MGEDKPEADVFDAADEAMLAAMRVAEATKEQKDAIRIKGD
jgi:hypothetical protein